MKSRLARNRKVTCTPQRGQGAGSGVPNLNACVPHNGQVRTASPMGMPQDCEQARDVGAPPWCHVVDGRRGTSPVGLEGVTSTTRARPSASAPHGQEPNIVVTSPGARDVGITTSPFMTSPHTEQINRYMKTPKPPQPSPERPAHPPARGASRGSCPCPLLIPAPTEASSRHPPTKRTDYG